MIFKFCTFPKLIQLLIFLAILLSPFMNITEVYFLISNLYVDQTQSATPVYIKGIKDALFFAILFVAFIHIILINKIRKILLFVLFCTVCLFAYPLYFIENVFIYIAGIRWFVPILLIFFLVPYINKEFLQDLTRLLFFIFIIHFFLQILELFLSGSHFGSYSSGLSKRNPGIFLIPNSGALFTIFVFFFHVFYASSKKKIIVFLLTPVSIVLTQSGTGIITYIVILVIYLLKDRYFKLLPFFGILIFLSYPVLLDFFVQREGYVEISFGTRINIFIDKFLNANFLNSGFGEGTNTAVLLLKGGLNSAFIADSIYASFIANLGMLIFIITFLFLLIIALSAFLNKNKEKFIFYILILLSGATTVLFEVYPINLLISVIFAQYISQYRQRIHEASNNPQ